MNTERGSSSVELTLMTPVLVLVLLLVVAGGRVVSVRGEVDAAARDGARAASMARTPGGAVTDATRAMDQYFDAGRSRCLNRLYDVDPGGLTSGDVVTVRVHCDVNLSDLALLPLPGTKTLSAEFREVVDLYRQAGS